MYKGKGIYVYVNELAHINCCESEISWHGIQGLLSSPKYPLQTET